MRIRIQVIKLKRIHADPDAVPDPQHCLKKDPNQWSADGKGVPGGEGQGDADPDPTFHPDADPNPSFQIQT
jgi:hypothetical protein